jgi:hypothetical protein
MGFDEVENLLLDLTFNSIVYSNIRRKYYVFLSYAEEIVFLYILNLEY